MKYMCHLFHSLNYPDRFHTSNFYIRKLKLVLANKDWGNNKIKIKAMTLIVKRPINFSLLTIKNDIIPETGLVRRNYFHSIKSRLFFLYVIENISYKNILNIFIWNADSPPITQSKKRCWNEIIKRLGSHHRYCPTLMALGNVPPPESNQNEPLSVA